MEGRERFWSGGVSEGEGEMWEWRGEGEGGDERGTDVGWRVRDGCGMEGEGEGERSGEKWGEVEGREMWGGRGGIDHQVGGEARRQHGCGPHLLVLEDLKLVRLAYKSRKMPFQIEPEALRAELQPPRDSYSI